MIDYRLPETNITQPANVRNFDMTLIMIQKRNCNSILCNEYFKMATKPS